MADKQPPRGNGQNPTRRTDLWPVIKANLAPILLVLSIFTSIAVTAYRSAEVTDFMTPEMRSSLEFVVKTINPSSISDWAKKRAENKAAVKATKDLSNRRWCFSQKVLAGADKVALAKCLNEKPQ